MNTEAYREIRKVSGLVPEKAAEEDDWQFWKEKTPVAPQRVEREEIVWNKDKFTDNAKATAQFYTLIANDVSREAAYSLSDLNRAVIHSIDNYAPEYPNAIKGTYNTVASTPPEWKLWKRRATACAIAWDTSW